jgi:activator of HSP90 ATPase
MTRTIQQSVRLPATARQLYDLYIHPRKHAAFTGSPVSISSRPGSRFRAFGGQLTGVMLFTIPGRMIVQRWRSAHFKKTDADSILILIFTQDGKQGRVDLAHVNVPSQDYLGVTKGWQRYYWKPMRAYLRRG